MHLDDTQPIESKVDKSKSCFVSLSHPKNRDYQARPCYRHLPTSWDLVGSYLWPAPTEASIPERLTGLCRRRSGTRLCLAA